MTKESKKNRTQNLIANFVQEEEIGKFAENWTFKVSKAFSNTLDIKKTQIITNKKPTLVWTQGENYNFEIGDTFHNNILAYSNWRKYLKSNPCTLQVSYISNNLLNIEIYKNNQQFDKLELHDNLFITAKEFVTILKVGL